MKDSKILYIKKLDRNTKWSNVLDRQFQQLKNLYGKGISLYEVNTSTIFNYLKNIFGIFKLIKKEKYDVLYVNHLICGLICIPNLFLVKRTILALHESEQALGWKFAIKHFRNIPLKHFLRYSYLFSLPTLFFKEILVLSDGQLFASFLRNKSCQLNFLGIDMERFQLKTKKDKSRDVINIFFPHNPRRPDKGFNYADMSLRMVNFDFELDIGGDYDYDEMTKLYFDTDIVLITTIYETYSLVLLEPVC